MSPAAPTLVLQVHPLTESYNAALLDAVVETLTSAGRSHTVARLAQGDAVERDDLAAVEQLIVVAPTWWGAMPSQLLGWLQTTLGPWIDGPGRGDDVGTTSGDAVGAPLDRSTSPLQTVRRLTVVTTYGSSRFINGLQGEPGRHYWRRTVLPLCAPDARFDWVCLYKMDRIDAAARTAFIARVRQAITNAVPEPSNVAPT